jgi:teichuronic acid biosynthesis glycosyltransferase TuaC
MQFTHIPHSFGSVFMVKIPKIFRPSTIPLPERASDRESQQRQSPRMRVLVLSHMFPNPLEPYAGIFVLEQMRALRQLGVDIIAIAPKPWIPSILHFVPRFGKFRVIPPRANVQGFRVEYPRVLEFPGGRFFYLYGLFYFIRCFRLVRQLVSEGKIDLIHAHTIMPDGFAAVLLGRKFDLPVVCTIQGSDINDYPWRSRPTLWATKWASRTVDSLVAISHDLEKKVFSLVGTRQLEVVHNGADPTKFRCVPKEKARARLDLPANKKIILFVGNLVPVKGLEYLLDAVSQLARSDILLCLVGDGELKSTLLCRAKRLGLANICRLVGPRPHDEIPMWLSAADCLVLSSLSEGLGTILTEAMLCRVPVIAPAVGGIPDIVRPGCTGTLVPPKDPVALAKAIDAVLGGDARFSVMVEQAETRAKAELTWESIARRILSIYQAQVHSRCKETSADASDGGVGGFNRSFE